MIRNFVSLALLGTLAAAANAAITFSNFTYNSAQFASDPTVSANALTWASSGIGTTAGLDPASTSTPVTFSFDALTTTGSFVSAYTLGQIFTTGSGAFTFTQTVYALNASGNVTTTLATLSNASDSNALTFAPGSTRNRVATTFTLNAPSAGDFSGLTLVNQNVQTAVPAPAALATFGMGALGTLRRRARRNAR